MSEIVDAFSRIHRDTPERRLVHLPSSRISLTAVDIHRAWERQRARLHALGLGADDLLVCAAGNHAAVVPLWLACRSLGIALMPVDGGTTAGEIATDARRFGATFAVLRDDVANAAAIGDRHSFEDGLWLVRVSGAEAMPRVYRGAAVLKLTSGSSGLPKATFTTERNLVLDSRSIIEGMDIKRDDCQIASIPISHAYGIGNLVMPLLLQGTPFVLRDGFVPHRFSSDAAAYAARIFPGVPFMFDHFIGHFPADEWPRSIRILISAGARLEPDTARGFHRTFGLKIHSFYGATETGGIAYDDSQEIDGFQSVGRPLPGVRITLRADADAPSGCGRVHVAGQAVASGYAGDDSSSEVFDEHGFLTGDFGRFDERQHLILAGRASSFINIAGRKVQPEEVEQVLRSMPEIADVRVIAGPDRTRGQQIIACIVSRGDQASAVAIRRFCAARLAPHKIPRTILHLERIPLTERGKTNRAALEALVLSHLQQAAK